MSFLKHEELSMPVQPDSFAIGANLLATSDPAEKKAKLTEEKSKLSMSSTTISKPFRWMGVILASNLKKAQEALSKIKVVNV